MELFKFSLALVLLIIPFASIPSSSAQNTPQDYLDVHNRARAQVRVGPLHWHARVAAYARNYALKVQRTNTCNRLVHSGGPYGENLAAGTGAFTGRQAVEQWVREKRFYNYRLNRCVGGICRHYTQVVWRRSIRLGCARVRCNNGWWFVICNYDPRGNIGGQRPY